MPANLMGLRENPFAAGHDPRLIFNEEQRAGIVAGFRQALASNEPFILVTGEAGVGKTSVVTQVLAEEKSWSALITNPLLTRAELLEEICLRFGVDLPESVSKPRLLAELERHLTEIRREEESPLLVVDEAHDLSLELLEELRLLSNLQFQGRPLVQIVLVGLPALEARLAQADLAQLRQRITSHLRVRPLDGQGTWQYIHHRVAAAGGEGAERFPDETCIEIHRLTRGVPRSINTLAGHALLAASRESERVVTVAHVQAASADTWLRNAADAPPASSVPSKAARSTPTPAPSDTPAPPAATRELPPKPASKKAAKAAPRPAAPASEPPVEPAATEPQPPRTSGEPEVREWISRFVDPDNPIQIGVRAGLASETFAPPSLESEDSTAAEGGEEGVVAPPKRRSLPRGGPPAGRSSRRRRDTTWITAGAGVVIVIAALIVFGPKSKPHGVSPADSSQVANASAAPSTAPARPARTPATIASKTRRGSGADSTAVKHWHGIEVASYLDPYRASSESARLSELTGLSGRVVGATDAEGQAFRVVLGSFGSRKKAERAADALINRGLIDQARVVPLGKTTPE
jgi:type II secretory pathway predicted ATPase ExeA